MSKFIGQDSKHERDDGKTRYEIGKGFINDDYYPSDYSGMPDSIFLYARLISTFVMLFGFIAMIVNLDNFSLFIKLLLLWFGIELLSYFCGFHWLRKR